MRSILFTNTMRGYPVMVCLSPYLDRLRLHTRARVQNDYASVEDSQASFDLSGEVDMPWRIEQIDLVPVPRRVRSSSGDSDASLTLLVHVVRLGRAVIDAADLVCFTSEVEYALGHGSLARVDVRDYPDVA